MHTDEFVTINGHRIRLRSLTQTGLIIGGIIGFAYGVMCGIVLVHFHLFR